MQRTRKDILTILKRKKKATLDELATALGLVPVTVRAHLSVLERQNLIGSQEVRGRIGRPFYVYSLTEGAEELFPKRYDTLASRLLEAIEAVGGEKEVKAVLDCASSRWAGEYAGRMRGKGLLERVAEVTRIRDEEGAMAEYQQTSEGYVISEHNCVAFLVSQRRREVCSVEAGFLSKLLDLDVEQTSCMLDGAAQCSFLVRNSDSSLASEITNIGAAWGDGTEM